MVDNDNISFSIAVEQCLFISSSWSNWKILCAFNISIQYETDMDLVETKILKWIEWLLSMVFALMHHI